MFSNLLLLVLWQKLPIVCVVVDLLATCPGGGSSLVVTLPASKTAEWFICFVWHIERVNDIGSVILCGVKAVWCGLSHSIVIYDNFGTLLADAKCAKLIICDIPPLVVVSVP
jgi:hypothetical protein